MFNKGMVEKEALAELIKLMSQMSGKGLMGKKVKVEVEKEEGDEMGEESEAPEMAEVKKESAEHPTMTSDEVTQIAEDHDEKDAMPKEGSEDDDDDEKVKMLLANYYSKLK